MTSSVKMEEANMPVNKEKELCEPLTIENYTPHWTVIFFAEVLGTAVLLFFGCMGVCAEHLIDDMPMLPHFGGIGFGLTVLMVIQAIGHISGAHLNPQVTFAAYVFGKIKLFLVPIYIAAEFIGAVLGYGLLKVVSPQHFPDNLCETVPDRRITDVQALIIEITITCVLILICAAVWDPRNNKNTDSTPLRFGLIIAGISMVAGTYSGASMNTARSFAPALLNGNWEHHWIYWVGPTAGTGLGVLIYKYIFNLPKELL